MKRKRVTVTIKEDVINQVDRIIDGLTIRSRSQAIEFLLTKFLSDFQLKNALVLAGGKDMLERKPKVLQPIKGKTLLEHSLSKLNEFGISNFLVYLDFKQDIIRNTLQAKKTDFNVSFISGDKPIGTIEPLFKTRARFDDTFLMAYGDTVSSLNINEMLSFHKKNNSLATIALTTVSNPKKYGVAMLQGNKITEFIQKPEKNVKSFLVSAGYFLFEPEIYKYISRDMKNLEKDLFPRLAEKGLLHGYPFQGMYLNINSESDLKKAKALL